MKKDLNEILTHYLVAVLFTEELDEFTVFDFTDESKEKAMADIVKFTNEAHELLTEWPEEQIGHDFWLTRNGHGAGFWDRTEWPNGDEITSICEDYEFHGEVYSFNGEIHMS